MTNDSSFIPLPNETKETYETRIKTIRRYLDEIKQGVKHLHFPTPDLQEMHKDFFGFYSNYKMPFYCGALTLQCTTEEGYTFPLVQLPSKKKWYHYISKTELLEHEAVHARRCGMKSPLFEEMLAYRTSPNWFRRTFGPLFSSLTESILFLGACLTAPFIPYMNIIAGAFGLYLFLQLGLKHFLLYGAQKFLSQHYKDPNKVLEYLTDQEIIQAAKGTLPTFSDTEYRKKHLSQST